MFKQVDTIKLKNVLCARHLAWWISAILMLPLMVPGCRPQAIPRDPATESPASEHQSIPVESKRQYLGDSDANAPSDASTLSQKPWFKDATAESGVAFTYQNGREGQQFTILETVGGGAALLDFDSDGDLDLFIPGGGTIASGADSQQKLTIRGLPAGLFQNDGQAHFQNVSSLIEPDPNPAYSHGAFVADYDRDGDPDVLVTGFGKCSLLRNEAGRKFVDVADMAGLKIPGWSTAAAWADVNRDGWSDLFVVCYVAWDGRSDTSCGQPTAKIRDVCPPSKYPPAKQYVFLNQKDGTFREVPQALDGSGTGKGLGIVASDLNDDGYIDFYIANDEIANQLYLGGTSFPLKEVGAISGTSGNEFGIPEGSMGVDAGDYNGDGRPDLWVVNFELEDNSLYQNQGDGLFLHASVLAGLGGKSRPQVKFGTGFADFDLDGWLDLFVINGHVFYETGQSAYLQQPFLYHNVSGTTGRMFQDVTRQFGGNWFQGKYPGRGAAVGDLDNDGDQDLVVVHQEQPVSILLNQTQPQNWLRIELRGTVGDREAIGATVNYDFNGHKLVRHIRSGAGYLSQFDSRIVLPIDLLMEKENRLEVRVRWLNGRRERFANLRPRETNLIEEGRGEPQ